MMTVFNLLFYPSLPPTSACFSCSPIYPLLCVPFEDAYREKYPQLYVWSCMRLFHLFNLWFFLPLCHHFSVPLQMFYFLIDPSVTICLSIFFAEGHFRYYFCLSYVMKRRGRNFLWLQLWNWNKGGFLSKDYESCTKQQFMRKISEFESLIFPLHCPLDSFHNVSFFRAFSFAFQCESIGKKISPLSLVRIVQHKLFLFQFYLFLVCSFTARGKFLYTRRIVKFTYPRFMLLVLLLLVVVFFLLVFLFFLLILLYLQHTDYLFVEAQLAAAVHGKSEITTLDWMWKGALSNENNKIIE